jgi:hypothetical protein
MTSSPPLCTGSGEKGACVIPGSLLHDTLKQMMPPGDQSKASLMHPFRHRPLAPGTGARQSDRAPHSEV